MVPGLAALSPFVAAPDSTWCQFHKYFFLWSLRKGLNKLERLSLASVSKDKCSSSFGLFNYEEKSLITMTLYVKFINIVFFVT